MIGLDLKTSRIVQNTTSVSYLPACILKRLKIALSHRTWSSIRFRKK